jgi:hypothetical protein
MNNQTAQEVMTVGHEKKRPVIHERLKRITARRTTNSPVLDFPVMVKCDI